MISSYSSMGKKLTVLLSAFMFFTLLTSFPTAKAADTDWTGYTPISSKEELDGVRNNLSGKYYLTADIVFTEQDFTSGGGFYNDGAGWLPIGANGTNAFTGTFDGNGHAISGISCSITSSSTDVYTGLFGYNKGTIQNLGMTDNDIRAMILSQNTKYAGGIAGYNEGTISNCYNTGNVSTSNFIAGGIAALNRSIISNCYNTGIINCKNGSAGGIAGNIISGTINDSYNTGNICGYYSGGIVGLGNGGKISNCYNIGSVLGVTSTGIMGGSNTGITVENCYYLNIGSGKCASGIALNIDNMKDHASFAGFDFTNVWRIDNGGIYPFPTLQNTVHIVTQENTVDFDGGNGTIVNPYRISNKNQVSRVRNYCASCFFLTDDVVFTTDDFAQGGAFYNDGSGWTPIGANYDNAFFGRFDGNGHTISGLYCNINSTTLDVGLFGHNRGVIQNLGMTDSDIRATHYSGGTYAGGIAGYNDGIINNCYNTGNVSTKAYYAGGITGCNRNLISNCYNTGDIKVSSINYAGGITGVNDLGTISDCYNTGNVYSDYCSGGIVGMGTGSNGSFGIISNCYNIGGVRGSTPNGIVGVDYNTTFVNCYYIDRVAGEDGSGTALTLDQMHNSTSYSGFDFTNVWIIDNAGVYPFPTLKNMTHIAKPENTIDFDGGNGTILNPYRISNKDQLDRVRKYSMSCFIMTGDIVFSTDDFAQGGAFYNDGSGWDPIGENDINSFWGVFDGNEHTISGLCCDITQLSSDFFIGLFGYNKGVIQNLKMEDSQIRMTVDSCIYAGGISGANYGIIKASCNMGNLSTNTNSCLPGGIAGLNYGDITDCLNTGDIVGREAGGIAAHISGYGVISNSYNTGNIGGQYIGGIAGTIDSAPGKAAIFYCYNRGNVSASGYAGGIAGSNSYGAVSACFNAGNVSSEPWGDAGGIVAFSGADIDNCYNTGDVSGPNNAGGITGQNGGSTTNCYNTGNVSSKTSAGGIVGSEFYHSAVNNCYYPETISININSGSTPGTALTDEQMKLKTSFSGFDFDNIWQQDGFWPYLRVFPYNELISIAFDDSSVQVATGATFQTKLQFTPENATFANITYTSLDTNVATVNKNGIISAIKAGTTSIIAQDAITKKAAICTVTVVQGVTGIMINGSKSTINTGNALQLSATVTPANAVNKTVHWSSSDAGIATVDQNGLVRSYSPGSVTIDAASTDGTKIQGSFGITVYQAVQSVSLNESSLQMKNGESHTLTATVLPANATNKSVAWSSSDTAVATVDATGKITAKSRGTTVVKCKTVDGGFEAACNVTVIQQVTGVSFEKTTIYMGLNGHLRLVPLIAPSNANNQAVSWDSSDPGVVSVSDDGDIAGVSEGLSIVITAKTLDGNFKAMCVVNVGKAVTDIVLNKTQLALVEGTTETLSVSSILPADAINKDIVWKTSDASVATVDANGKMTAVKPGMATISAEAADGSGVNASCGITVNTRTLKSIEVATMPGKLVYREMATFDGAGMVLKLTFDNGFNALISAGWTTEYDFSVSGQRTVVVRFGGLSTELYVTVNPFVVSFDSCGGSGVPGVTAHYNATIAAPAEPTKIGCAFTGWYKEASCTSIWDFTSDTIQADTALYAGWKVATYAVAFHPQGGTAVPGISANYGSTIAAPATPKRTNYNFGGWYMDAACTAAWNFATDTVTSNITLYARWTMQTPGALLSGIKLSAGTLSPAFRSSTTGYTVNLKETDASVKVTPAKAYDGATMTIDGKKVSSKTVTVANDKSATVTVKLTWGSTSKTYRLTIKRPKSTNNKLSSLKVSAGVLSPVFSASTTSYNLKLSKGTSRVTITAVKASSLATVTPATKTYTLKNGQTITVTVKVKSQSGAIKTYKIVITRAK